MAGANREGLNRSILKLAIPNIISNITVPLLGLVDMMLMGLAVPFLGLQIERTITKRAAGRPCLGNFPCR